MNLLSLDKFRELIGYHPFHFWQQANKQTPLQSRCITLVMERAYMWADRAGRFEINEAIKKAEQKLQEQLGYTPGSKYLTDKISLGCPIHTLWPKMIELQSSKVQAIQTETLNFLGEQPLTFSDEDGDGLEDTFETSFADSTTDPGQIEIYFPVSTLPVMAGGDVTKYDIRPIVCTRTNATTLKVQGKKWLLLKPVNRERQAIFSGYNPEQIAVDTSGAFDPNDINVISQTIGVYARTVSKINKAYLTSISWDGLTTTTQEIDVRICNAQTGQVSILNHCSGFSCSCGQKPLELLINYRAGDDLTAWEWTIAKLAMAYLSREICACEKGNQEVYRWSFDLARAGGIQSEQFRIDPADLANPIGTRLGMVSAWKEIIARRIVRGIAI